MVEAQPSHPSLPASLAHLGALIGDPVRAAILVELSDGSRRPAGELAQRAGTSQQAVSAHLARLVEGGLLRVEPQGRHRFYALASGDIAESVEALANWLDQPRRTVPRDPALREARLCYDHLAGHLGVAMFDRMAALGFFAVDSGGTVLGEAGQNWCHRLGVPSRPPPGSRRPSIRLCLDWTERRHHLGGHLGAALTRSMLENDLLRPGKVRRVLLLTVRGSRFLQTELGLCLPRSSLLDCVSEPPGAAHGHPLRRCSPDAAPPSAEGG